jgi:hypothetical protein
MFTDARTWVARWMSRAGGGRAGSSDFTRTGPLDEGVLVHRAAISYFRLAGSPSTGKLGEEVFSVRCCGGRRGYDACVYQADAFRQQAA